ncbi:MAG: hypothetical protein K0S47_818 [Herbinix sp.]|jgi:hypothetical protein|nr:hypothetical protein [Herbinix sp.]
MSFGHKDTDINRLDDRKIKSHLNTSLEKDGISVSEDLINRTLEAIRKQENTPKEDIIPQKVARKPWSRYVRSVAGVAAAAVVLLVGYQAYSYLGAGSHKEESAGNSTDSAQYAADEAAEDMNTTMITEEAPMTASEKETEEAQLYTIEGTADNAASTEAADDVVPMESADQVGKSANDTGAGTDALVAPTTDTVITGEADVLDRNAGITNPVGVTFNDICILTAENVKELTLTNQEGVQVILTEKEDIDAFYELMNMYSYTNDETVKIPLKHDYKIDLKAKDNLTMNYSIRVADGLEVTYSNDTSDTINNYTITDREGFLNNLGEFFNQYN